MLKRDRIISKKRILGASKKTSRRGGSEAGGSERKIRLVQKKKKNYCGAGLAEEESGHLPKRKLKSQDKPRKRRGDF